MLWLATNNLHPILQNLSAVIYANFGVQPSDFDLGCANVCVNYAKKSFTGMSVSEVEKTFFSLLGEKQAGVFVSEKVFEACLIFVY